MAELNHCASLSDVPIATKVFYTLQAIRPQMCAVSDGAAAEERGRFLATHARLTWQN